MTNSAGVAVGDLAAAEQLAGQVYARIGVEMMWTDTDAAAALTEGAVHLDVLLLTEAMSALRQPHEQVLGSARADARRAWLYTGRIDKHALLTHANPIRVLAVVLAHELGHLLLEYHHARTGLMRAEWEGRIVKIPDLLPAEARAIQATLLTTTEHQRLTSHIALK